MVRCTARGARVRIAFHASIIFPRAYPRDAVRERAEHDRCDGRGAAAGRNRGRRCRSRRGRRLHGRDRGARPSARRRPFAFDPARTTLRACATRRGPLGRADARPDLPAARDSTALRRSGSARATPAPRGLAPSSRSRPCERWRSARWPTSAQRDGACAGGGPRPPCARAPPHRKRRQAPHRARADDGRCRRSARRTGRARGHYDACRTGRNRPPGSWRGTSSLGVQTRRRRHSGGPPPLPRTLPSPCRSRRPIRLPPPLPRIHVSPRRSRRPIRLPTALPRIHVSPRRSRRPIRLTTRRAPDICDARGRARYMGRADSARDAELRRREAEGRLWPTDPPFCPAAWSGPG